MKKNQSQRRVDAYERLEAQLESGVKPEKINGKTTGNSIPLTEGDITRINREMTTLKGRM